MQLEEKSTSTNHTKPTKSTHSHFVVILALLAGFFGGAVSNRLTAPQSTASTIDRQVIESEGELIANIVEEVKSSVVSIDVVSFTTSFNPFFGSTSSEQDSAGSGIIISEDGLILTNKHVLPESLTEVRVELSDGTVYDDVEVLGRDPFNDVAFLKIKNVSGLTAAKLADSDSVRVGQKVIAIGNALGEFDTTVTSGIISGLGRPIIAGVGNDSEQLANLFQTDTSINPGNSGGPLLNLEGQVIGVNTAVAGDAENIGFAIPINDIKSGIASVEKNGKLVRPYLGVRYVTLNDDVAKELELDQKQGAYIYSPDADSAIITDGPADKAGLEPKDIITHVGERELNENVPLPTAVSRYQVGDTVTLKVVRGKETIEIDVLLEAAPSIEE